jgi:hypothetical protein
MRRASEIVYADSIEGLRKQLFFEAEYSDVLEERLREFVELADRSRGLLGLPRVQEPTDG